MKRLILLFVSVIIVAFATAQEKKLHVTTPGTLSTLVGNEQNIEKLVLTGSLDDSDLRFIRSLPRLKKIDLYKLSNKHLGDSAFYGMKTLEYARLPKKLTTLGRSAFRFGTFVTDNDQGLTPFMGTFVPGCPTRHI